LQIYNELQPILNAISFKFIYNVNGGEVVIFHQWGQSLKDKLMTFPSSRS
jgi:hypothetical protein